MALPEGDDGMDGRAFIRQVRSAGLAAADEVGSLLAEGLKKGLENQFALVPFHRRDHQRLRIAHRTLSVRPSWATAPAMIL